MRDEAKIWPCCSTVENRTSEKQQDSLLPFVSITSLPVSKFPSTSHCSITLTVVSEVTKLTFWAVIFQGRLLSQQEHSPKSLNQKSQLRYKNEIRERGFLQPECLNYFSFGKMLLHPCFWTRTTDWWDKWSFPAGHICENLIKWSAWKDPSSLHIFIEMLGFRNSAIGVQLGTAGAVAELLYYCRNTGCGFEKPQEWIICGMPNIQ